MHEFNLALKDIVNVAETFSSKYNYMEDFLNIVHILKDKLNIFF